MVHHIEYDQSDPRHYTAKVRALLEDVARRARAEGANIDESTAHALVETTAAVCSALAATFEHYERQPRLVQSPAR